MRMALTQLTWIDTASRLAPAPLATAMTAVVSLHLLLTTAIIFITTSLHLLLLLWVITMILLLSQNSIRHNGWVPAEKWNIVASEQNTFLWCSSCGVWRMLWEVTKQKKCRWTLIKPLLDQSPICRLRRSSTITRGSHSTGNTAAWPHQRREGGSLAQNMREPWYLEGGFEVCEFRPLLSVDSHTTQSSADYGNPPGGQGWGQWWAGSCRALGRWGSHLRKATYQGAVFPRQ